MLLGCSRGLLKPSYQPSSPKIEQLALATTMTPEAQQLFYQQDPKIQPKEKFRSFCRKASQDPEKTIILGCFTSNGYTGSIVIQSISDPRLQGMMEVVAAHEMLHAAYHTFSPQDRQRLEPKLRKAARRVTDTNLLSILEAYEDGDPEIYVNELHSHLGTQLNDLGDPDLEEHYQQYFSDRQRVVAFAKRSRKELNQLEAQAEQLKPEIDALKLDLESEESILLRSMEDLKLSVDRIERMRSDLQALRQQVEALIDRGDASLVSQFEREQERFNAEVRQYNAQVQAHREQVDQYHQQFDTYEQKISEYNQLTQTKQSILSSLRSDQPDFSVPQATPQADEP